MAKKKGSAVNVIEGIVITVLILLIAAMLFMYFSFSKNGAAPSIFGHTFYHTMAVNMEPEIPADTVVIGKTNVLDEIKVGSVIVCTIGEDTVLTRVVQLIGSENGEMAYVVKFDTAPANDTFKIPAENVIARATTQSKLLGSVLSFATSTFGIMLVIIIPSFIIIVFQIIRIVNVKRTEEDAVSLDELNQVMIPEDLSGDFFSEPPSFTDDDAPAAPRKPIAQPAPKPQERTVLSLDKNGKAGLTAVRDDDSPLFSFANATYDDKKAPAPAKVKPVKASPERAAEVRKPVYTEPETYIEPVADEIPEEEEQEQSFSFMSTVLPRGVAEVQSPAPEAEEEPVKEYEPKSNPADKLVKETKGIPGDAVIPREKLSPPKKKNNRKAISELMSIIDAEETKLKK